ncbi:MFS transporter [Rarobacter faecitabidus]|uniref:MFS transporter n=1 Tax=Rarobacter faecitabidus TaxID=13243 RepID=UPI001FE24FD2|nr:MFS transporter [Rarobacter faecitabidus]
MSNPMDGGHETPAPADENSGRRRRSNPYLSILSRPGAASFSAAAAIARLPMSMIGLAIVLIIERSYGSYAAGGRVSAAYLIAAAAAVPQIARLIDRRGQSRVMRPLVVANGIFVIGLGFAIIAGLPEPVLWLLAAGVGATVGAFGALVRARWTFTLGDSRALHTAFSLESALDEFIFVIGPTLATVLVVQVWPLAGLLVPAVAAVGGGLWFCSQRATEPPVASSRASGGGRAGSVLRNPALIALSAIFLFIGVVFGSVEVTTVAFAKEVGSESMAGVVLGIFALGSMLAGLAYGARHWRSALTTRLLATLVILTAGMSALLLATSLWHVALILLLAGVSIAPTLITGTSIVHTVVGQGQLTEGLAWTSTAMTIGVSGGTAVAGILIDGHGARAGYLLTSAGSCVALVLAALAAAAFARQERRRKDESSVANANGD